MDRAAGGAAPGRAGTGALARAAFPHRRKPVHAPGAPLLWGICACAFLASLLQSRYGLSANLESILWMCILSALFYGQAYSMDRRSLRRYLLVQYGTFLAIWSGACCLSLVQFALRIGKVGPRHATTPLLGGNGFYLSRLYGLFTYPEYGAIPGAMLLLLGVCAITKARARWAKILLVLPQIPIFCYIVLCGSRNGLLALYAGAFVGGFFSFRNLQAAPCGPQRGTGSSMKKTPSSVFFIFYRNALPFLLSLALVGCLHGLFLATRHVAQYVPAIFAGSPSSSGNRLAGMPGEAGPCVHDTDGWLLSNSGRPPSPLPAAVSFRSPRDAGQSAKSGKKKKSAIVTIRSYDRDGDLTTGRTRIWRDYLALAPEIGLFGLSPENASWYIQGHHPDFYIAAYIREHSPNAYQNGQVFHTHSGYLMVFVSAGFTGIALLVLYMGLCVRRIIRHVRRNRQLSPACIFSLAAVVAGASSALFDLELFFVYNPTTLLFWLCLGLLMRATAPARARRHA